MCWEIVRAVAMSQARSVTAFTRSAAAFDVHESDFLVMMADKISSFEALAFRFPKESDFETYLNKSVRVKAAYTDAGGNTVVYDKSAPESWEAFRSSEDCGCLRKLWNMGVQIAKKELEALASGQDDSTVSKMTTTLAQELEEKAIPLGMPKPLSDRERPSLHTLGKVQSNFSPGGQHLHLAWESYIDQEMEGRLRRAGRLPRDKSEVVLKGQADDFPQGHRDPQHGQHKRCYRHERSARAESKGICHAECGKLQGLSTIGRPLHEPPKADTCGGDASTNPQ